eukprot:gene21276-28197_t
MSPTVPLSARSSPRSSPGLSRASSSTPVPPRKHAAKAWAPSLQRDALSSRSRFYAALLPLGGGHGTHERNPSAASASASGPEVSDCASNSQSSADALSPAGETSSTGAADVASAHRNSDESVQASAASQASASPISPALSTEVTKHNFKACLPAIRAALDWCDFFAFDCEFSGLHPEQPRLDLEGMDDACDRYIRMARAAQNFSVVQFGLSCLRWDKAEGRYEAQNYNFWVFTSAPDSRFMCQSSSLAFLASCGFDFNKWIREGIPYTQLDALSKPQQKVPMNPRQYRQVVDMMRSSGKPAVGHNMYLDLVLDLVRSSGKPAVGHNMYMDLDHVVDLVRSSGKPAVGHNMYLDLVVDLMRSSGKPAVGHNMYLDLVHVLDHFAEPLPERWLNFKEMVSKWFPGGLYDTKYIISRVLMGNSGANKPDRIQDTFHGDLFKVLMGNTGANRVDLIQDSSLGGLFKSLSQGGSLERFFTSKFHLPPPTAHQDFFPGSISPLGCVKLSASDTLTGNPSSSSSSGSEHEAGYDAMMTGVIFGRLLRLSQLLTSQLAPDTIDLMHWVKPYRGMLHSMNSELPYFSLEAPDPVPNRSSWYLLVGHKSSVYSIIGHCQQAGLGEVKVTTLPKDSPILADGVALSWDKARHSMCYLVEVKQTRKPSEVMQSAQSMPWKWIRYSEFTDARRKKAQDQMPVVEASRNPPKVQQGSGPVGSRSPADGKSDLSRAKAALAEMKASSTPSTSAQVSPPMAAPAEPPPAQLSSSADETVPASQVETTGPGPSTPGSVEQGPSVGGQVPAVKTEVPAVLQKYVEEQMAQRGVQLNRPLAPRYRQIKRD